MISVSNPEIIPIPRNIGDPGEQDNCEDKSVDFCRMFWYSNKSLYKADVCSPEKNTQNDGGGNSLDFRWWIGISKKIKMT
jgi:hypothetical protein